MGMKMNRLSGPPDGAAPGPCCGDGAAGLCRRAPYEVTAALLRDGAATRRGVRRSQVGSHPAEGAAAAERTELVGADGRPSCGPPPRGRAPACAATPPT